MNAIAVWWSALRPRTLGASVVPVLVGTAYASRTHAVDITVLLLTTAAALALQVTTNLANDYYDFRNGIDGGERLGPPRASASGLLAPSAVKRGAYTALVVAVVLGTALVAHGGLPILMIGLAAALCAIAYSAGPAPLASLGFGEGLAFLFFGVLAVVGSSLLQGSTFALEIVFVSLPIAALVTAIMVVNNLRDIPTDQQSGKVTMAVRLGDRRTRVLYSILVASAFLSLLVLAGAVGRGALVPGLLLPLALSEARALWQRQGRELNLSLAGTARLHALFGLLYAVGLSL